MLKLLRVYGKPLWPMFLISVILLVIRAASELSLPSYMSAIVDYGIAQQGVDSVVPQAMSAETFYRLSAMLPQEYIQEFDGIYSIITTSVSYDLHSIFRDIVIGLDYILISPASPELTNAIMLALAYLESPAAISLDYAIAYQLALRFVQNEYARLGVDMAALQLAYVFSTGQVMIFITFIAITAAILVAFISSKISTAIAKNIRADIFKKVVGFTNTEYNNFSTASLITRCTNDVQQVQNLMAISIRIVVFSPIMAVGGILMVVGTDISMAWIIALAVAAIVTFIVLFIIIATPRFRIMQKLIDKVNLVTREALTGLMVTRAFTTQKHEAQRFEEVNNNLKNNVLFLARVGALQMPIIALIMNFTTIAIVWIGAGSIQAGGLLVGDIMAFVQYTIFIVMAFLMFAMIIIMLPRAQVAAGRILQILETKQVVLDTKTPKNIGKEKGDIEFKNVSFKYPEALGCALEDISFKVKSGEVTAIVGSTGSGKSALINLIPRFYDTSSGDVLINGVNVKDILQEQLRELIGYVPQKSTLFSGTIESNIKYASSLITDEDMINAAKIAQAQDFINEKTEKYKDSIAQGGTNVSGGQRQRLSIARAIAKKPKIYIFDDSFSALDFKTDVNLRTALQKNIKDATVIIVASRIGTIKNADQIVVLDLGKVVGKGQHNELLSTCEIYKQIATSQLSEEELKRDMEVKA